MSIITVTKRKRTRTIQNNPMASLYWRGQLPVGNGPFHLFDIGPGRRVIDANVEVTIAGVHGAGAMLADLVLCQVDDAAPGASTVIVNDANMEAVGNTRMTSDGQRRAPTVDIVPPIDQSGGGAVLALFLSVSPDTSPAAVAITAFVINDDLAP